MSKLIDLVAKQAQRIPDQIALRAGDETMRYGVLPFAIAATAARINRVDPGSAPVGIDLDNGISWVLADLALRQLGRVAVTLLPSVFPIQREAALAATGASCVIEARGIRLLDGDAEGIAKIGYCAATTGLPISIQLSDDHLLAAADIGAGRSSNPRPIEASRDSHMGLISENVGGLYAALIAGREYCFVPAVGLRYDIPLAPNARSRD